MPIVELGDVCEFLDHQRKPVSEELRKPGPYPYYGANGQQGWVDGYIFDEPLVLLAEDGGHFGSRTSPIAYKISGKTWVNNHAHVLRPLPRCDIDYLAHALSFYDVSKLVTGSTRPKLTKGNAETIRIPLPSLSEQRRTAGQLEKADRLRRMQRYALELSDALVPATFIQLFDEPVRNPQGWPVERLSELGEVTTGGTPPTERPGMFGGTIPFLTPGDLEANTAHPNRYLTEAGATETGTVRAGSTLVCCIGATIGKTDIARVRSAFNQQINAVEWSNHINDSFGLYVMRFFSKVVADRGRSTTLPILKKSAFEEICVPVPPLPMQQQFAKLVTRHERLRTVPQESLRQAEHLFQTLLHRAFTGNLQL